MFRLAVEFLVVTYLASFVSILTGFIQSTDEGVVVDLEVVLVVPVASGSRLETGTVLDHKVVVHLDDYIG